MRLESGHGNFLKREQAIITLLIFQLSNFPTFQLTTVSAQQPPQYTQYMFNQFGLNPAVAGIFDCIDIKAGYRTQWVGFEGAPKTMFVSVHGPLRQRRQGRGRHGIGAYVVSDRIGPSSTLYLHLAYAYHLKLRERLWASAGFFLGLQQYKFDAGGLTLPIPTDAAVPGSSAAWVFPDIMPGVWIYSYNAWFGVSAKHVVGNRLKPHGPDSDLSRHFYIMGGRRMATKSGITYTPSFLLKYVGAAPLSLDGSVLVDFSQRLGLGLSYRHQDAVAAILRLRLTYSLSVSYSYDYTLSPLRTASSNTHEFIIGWSPCGKSSGGATGGRSGGGGGDCPAYH